MSQMKKTTTSLSVILRDDAKREALLELRGYRAQCLVDFLDYILSDPEFRMTTEPELLSLVMAASCSLCDISMRYPTCYVLSGIRGVSPTGYQGGRIKIYRGHHDREHLGLKTIGINRKQNRGQLLRSLAREAFLWNQLDHPNIVPFYGISRLDRTDRIFLVSPWMENGNMAEYLEMMPTAPRKSFIYDIANGLDYLHSRCIVHGDLQGRNILIDNRQQACLADFGLSTIETGTLHLEIRTENVGSTAYWTSPECMYDNAPLTCASDVWAFACLCYGVLARRKSFTKFSRAQAISKLRKGELPLQLEGAILDEEENLNKKMLELLKKCWSIKAEQRPTSSDILRELENIPIVQHSHDPGLRSFPSRENPSRPRFLFRAPGSTVSINLNAGQRILEELCHGIEVASVSDAMHATFKGLSKV